MFGYILNSIGLATISAYGALNYLTYKTINNNINQQTNFNQSTLKPLSFSPVFNYHIQIKDQLKTNLWSFVTMQPSKFKVKDVIFPMFEMQLEVTPNKSTYQYQIGNYKAIFSSNH